MAQKRSVVVWGIHSVGDAVLVLPALREIRRLYPTLLLVVVARPGLAGFFKWIPEVDETITQSQVGGTMGLKAVTQTASLLRQRRPLAFFCFHLATEGRVLAFLSGASQRFGYYSDMSKPWLLNRGIPFPEHLSRAHQTMNHLYLLQGTGVSSIDYLSPQRPLPNLSIRRQADMIETARTLTEKLGIPDDRLLVTLHTGGIHPHATHAWPGDRYATMIQRLQESVDARFILLGTSSESDYASAIMQKLDSSRVFSLCGQTTVKEMVSLIACSHLFISSATGLAHVAAAFDIPQVAIFGPTDPAVSSPLSPYAAVVHSTVECSPCFQRDCKVDLRCWRAISADTVHQRCIDVIAQRYSSKR